MTLRVRGPGGEVVNFPDDTPHEVINKAMSEHFGSSTQSQQDAQTPQQQTDAMSGPERYARGATYGLLSGAEGAVNTIGKSIEGADPQKLAKLQSLISAAKERMGVSSDQYAPASQATQDPNATIGQRLANVPRSVVEMAGPAIVGGMVGGIPGAVAATTATTAGPTIDRKREAIGLSSDQELPNEAKKQIAAKLGFDAVALGLGGQVTRGLMGPIESSGVRALTETGKRGLMAAGADAALGSSATGVDKLTIDNQRPSISDLTVGAAQGALPGLVAHTPSIAGKVPGAVGEAGVTAGKAVREPVVNRAFKPLESLNPESRSRVANMIDMYGSGEKGMNAAENTLRDDVSLAAKGLDDVTKEKIGYITNALKEGAPVKQEWIDAVNSVDPVAGRAVTDLNTFGAMRNLESNALYQRVKDINPLTNFRSRVTDYAIGHLLSPTLGKAIAAGSAGIAGAAYGIDKFTGLANPGKVITDRYAGTGDQYPSIAQAKAEANNLANLQRQFRTTADLYSASQELDKANKLKKDTDDAIKAEKKLAQLKAQFQTAASNDAMADVRVQKAESDANWKTARESVSAWNKNEDLRAKEDKRVSKEFDQVLGNVKYLNNVRENSESASSSDTGIALKLANLKKQLQDKRMSQLGTQAQIMRNSQVLAERQAGAEQAAKDQALARQVTLMRNSQATEQARQDALLRAVGAQNRIREASEARPYDEMVSDPGVFRANQALARDAFAAKEQAQAEAEAAKPREYNYDDTEWGPATSVKDRPKDVQALFDANKALLKTREKLQKEEKRAKATEERKAKQEQDKKDREAKKLENDKVKAKAAKTVKDASENKSKAEEKLSSTPIEDGDHIEVTVRGMTFRQRKDKVPNPQGWADATKENVEHRGSVIDEMSKVIPKDPQTKRDLKTLEHLWSERTRSPEGGQEHFEDFLHKQPLEVQSKLLDIYAKHEALLRTRWTPSK